MRVTYASTVEGRQLVEEITYRPDGIPTLFVQTFDGQETRRVEVRELSIKN